MRALSWENSKINSDSPVKKATLSGGPFLYASRFNTPQIAVEVQAYSGEASFSFAKFL